VKVARGMMLVSTKTKSELYAEFARREALKEHIRENQVWTRAELEETGKTVKEYRVVFGSWIKAREEAYHAPKFTVEYLRRLVARQQLYTKAKYQAFRNTHRPMCPSFVELKRIVGKSWTKFVEEAQVNDPKALLAILLKATANSGKITRWMFGRGGVPPITHYRPFFKFRDLQYLCKINHEIVSRAKAQRSALV